VFRLDSATRHNGVYLTIEGALNSESVEIIESACLKALAEHAKVTVNLNDVTEFDTDGLDFLKRIAARAHIRAMGIYSQYVLKNIMRELDI
jgi:anti-anti-sigma regulatory factor